MTDQQQDTHTFDAQELLGMKLQHDAAKAAHQALCDQGLHIWRTLQDGGSNNPRTQTWCIVCGGR